MHINDKNVILGDLNITDHFLDYRKQVRTLLTLVACLFYCPFKMFMLLDYKL